MSIQRPLLFLFVLAAVPLTLVARTYDTSHLPYSDPPQDRPTALAISTLTEDGILQGDPGGTIRPHDLLNRAEFVTIVVRTLPPPASTPRRSCFPDVSADAWYAEAVCYVQELGIVRGNARSGVAQSQWRFEPLRPVQYEEAVKILAKMYALATEGEGDLWFIPYLRAAEERDLALRGLQPRDRITRGEMARLMASFRALFSDGALPAYRAAERGAVSSSSSIHSSLSSSRSSRFSSSSLRSSTSSSSPSGTGSLSQDAYGDISIRSTIFLLGPVSPVLAAAKIFLYEEPLDIRTVTVELSNASASVDALLVFDDSRRFLGVASLEQVGGTRYVLRLTAGTFTVPKSQERSLYVRARTRAREQGGVSGETVQVGSIRYEGFGAWSNSAYNTQTTETFLPFRTARARITAIENAGPATGIFATGPNQLLGEFRFRAERSDSAAHPRLVTLTFQLAQIGGVSLTNVRLRTPGAADSHSCSVSGTSPILVTCASLPATFSGLDAPLVLQVFGDVAATTPSAASLRLTLPLSGTVSEAGSVTWTDDTTTFTWVPLSSPLVQGTNYSNV